MALIDLTKDSAKIIGHGFRRAAWSPDGKWIAAQGDIDQKVILFDTRTFNQSRTLGQSDVLWSPDSRYLLSWKSQILCGPYFFTLEKVDIKTGDRVAIKSSKCNVIESSGAWVSSEIAP